MVLCDFASKPDIALNIDDIEAIPKVSKLTLDTTLKALIMPTKNSPIDCILNPIPTFPVAAFGRKTAAYSG
jgi:hypothetical protein